MKHEDEFDGLLNEALREVREAEPRTGLEGRVLAGVRASAGERKISWWKWAAVAAVVIVLVFGITVRRGSKVDVVRKEPVPVVVPEKKSVEKTQEATAKDVRPKRESVAIRPVRKIVTTPRVVAEAEKAPFPTPLPMSSEEKALMLLARNNPEVLDSVQREQRVERREIAPIEIDEIKISGIGEKEQ